MEPGNMKTLEYMIETSQEQLNCQHANTGRVLLLNGHRLPLSADMSDAIHVFQDGANILILSINPDLNYMSLEVFNQQGALWGAIFVGSYKRLISIFNDGPRIPGCVYRASVRYDPFNFPAMLQCRVLLNRLRGGHNA
jgi:hypothetical protein